MSLQLSIGVPSYNVERYLEHDLATYADPRLEGLVEVIIVNDGSTDATHDIAAGFVQRMPGIFRLVDKPNGGHGSAVNAAMAAARGRYFRVIDADDWANTDELVELARRLEGCQADLVCDVKREVNMVTGQETLFPLPHDLPLGCPIPMEEACARPDFEHLVMIHTLSIKRELLDRIGLHLLEKTFYVDFQYVVESTLAAREVEFFDLNVYNYLVGNASQSVADQSYVRRWLDHTRVTMFMCDLYRQRAAGLSPARRAYLKQRVTLICNTHYNIALIFDHDRTRGARRAHDFRMRLKREYPEIFRATEKRYWASLALHAAGVDSQQRLDALTHRV